MKMNGFYTNVYEQNQIHSQDHRRHQYHQIEEVVYVQVGVINSNGK